LHGVDGTALLIGRGAGFGIGGYLFPQLGFNGSAAAGLAAGLAAGFPSAKDNGAAAPCFKD
jgi:hypothetical protein